ncbi:MAG: AsmA family protein [Akkermansiaceae bacterium]
MKKSFLLKALILLVCFFVLIGLAMTYAVRSFISKEYLAEKIEESVNSDVVIGELDYSLLGFPANLSLRDVSFSEKDSGETPLILGEVSLSVSLKDIFKKHIDVSSIKISGAKVSVIFREDGTNSLEELFEKPEVVQQEKEPAKDPSEKVPPKAIEEPSNGFNAFDQADFVATLGRFLIEDSDISITLEKTGLKLHCTDLNLDLSSIKIDPKQLHRTNTANLNIQTNISLDSLDGDHYGDLYLSGDSQTLVFNSETGEIEPNVSGNFSLSDESWLNTNVPFVTKAWSKLDVLNKIGVEVSPLPEKATFGRSKAIAVHYHLGRITVLKPVSVWVGDWEIAALDNSWLDSKTDQHIINAELLASEKASKTFQKGIEKGLDQLPQAAREIVTADIQSQILRDKRILVAVQSTGDFSDPKVRPTGAVVDYTNALKEAGRSLLKEKGAGLLEGFLKKL